MFDYMPHPANLEEVSAILKQEGTSVFLFSAPWCGDCRFIEPFMEKVMNNFPNIHFYYLNRDDFTDLALRWEIMGIPSFIAFRDQKEVGRFVSRLRKTEKEITSFLETL